VVIALLSLMVLEMMRQRVVSESIDVDPSPQTTRQVINPIFPLINNLFTRSNDRYLLEKTVEDLSSEEERIRQHQKHEIIYFPNKVNNSNKITFTLNKSSTISLNKSSFPNASVSVLTSRSFCTTVLFSQFVLVFLKSFFSVRHLSLRPLDLPTSSVLERPRSSPPLQCRNQF